MLYITVLLHVSNMLLTGGFGCTLPTVLVELNGIENVVKSIAIWTVAVGTGCLLGTPFSGICWQKCSFFR